MAKKFGKFLLGAVAIGGAAAAAYLYMQKKSAECDVQEEIDTDYDDFSEDQEETPSRNYVQLNQECTCDTIEENQDQSEIMEESLEEVTETIEAETVPADADPFQPEQVEEFFNEDNV